MTDDELLHRLEETPPEEWSPEELELLRARAQAEPRVREALAEWLVIPPGLDRAVETILGERVRGWLVDEPSAACRAVEFLKGKELGRGAFLPQQLRWAPEQAALDSSASWWPSPSAPWQAWCTPS